MLTICIIISFIVWYCWWATRLRIVINGEYRRIIAKTRLTSNANHGDTWLELSDTTAFPLAGEIVIGDHTVVKYQEKTLHALHSFEWIGKISPHIIGECIFGIK